MAYIRDVWRFPDSNEYEYKFAGNYGAKGEKRNPKHKATPEQIARQNQLNREKKVRRLIKANFTNEDFWVTLKYPRGARPSLEEVRADFQAFIRRLRYVYKKAETPLKFVYRIEIGSRGGIHIHMVIGRGERMLTDLEIQKAWTVGHINFEHLYDSGGYSSLASYIVKPPSPEAQKHLDRVPEEERKELIKYSASRNLVRPEPERKEYSHSTVRKLILEGPKPTPGYCIDLESVRTGVNAYTGMSYIHYTEVRLDPIPKGRPRKAREDYSPQNMKVAPVQQKPPEKGNINGTHQSIESAGGTLKRRGRPKGTGKALRGKRD